MNSAPPSSASLSIPGPPAGPTAGFRGILRIRAALARWGIEPGSCLVSAVLLLLTLGTVMVFSASFFHRSVDGDGYLFLRRQALWLPIAGIAGALASRIDHRLLARGYLWAYLATLGLLASVFVPGIGLPPINGARRWIGGPGNLQFQPSELAKLTTIILAAGFLTRDPTRASRFWKGFVPLCLAAFLTVGVILVEPDFGTAMFVLLVTFAVLLLAGVRKRFMILSALPLAPAIAWFMMWRWEKIRPRLVAFLDPESIYQVKQSLVSLGAGGMFGVGLGAGSLKLKFLPEPQTDFIFAVVGEELGFAGSVAVVGLFLLLLHSGAAIARRARDRFGFLLASGIVISLALQAAINLAVVTASAPTKGIPLPFITFGGSGLVMTLVQVGFLLSVDRASRAEASGAAAVEAAANGAAPAGAAPASAPAAGGAS